MASSRFLLFSFLLLICSFALLEVAAAPAAAPKKVQEKKAPKEEVKVITTPEIHATTATNDRSEEVITALREEIGRKDKTVTTLEAKIHSLEAEAKAAAASTAASAAASASASAANSEKIRSLEARIHSLEAEAKTAAASAAAATSAAAAASALSSATNSEKIRSLEETIRTQQDKIKALTEEVTSVRSSVSGGGSTASLKSVLEWLETEYRLQVDKHIPSDWKEKLQENSEAKLAALSYFLRNDLRPLLLEHKQTVLLKVQNALEQVENGVESQLQVLYRRYPELPSPAKTIRIGRYVAYGLGILVFIVAALFIWKVLGIVFSLIFGKKATQPTQSGRKKRKSGAAQ